jgi:hypothetical protein
MVEDKPIPPPVQGSAVDGAWTARGSLCIKASTLVVRLIAAKPNTDAASTNLLLVITIRSFSVPLRMTYSETKRWRPQFRNIAFHSDTTKDGGYRRPSAEMPFQILLLEGESACEHNRSTGDGGCCDLCNAWIRNPAGQSGWIEGIARILEAWMVNDVLRIHPKLQFA